MIIPRSSKPVIFALVPTGRSLGVAILAAVGTGMYSSVEEACAQIIKPVTSQKPIAVNVPTYNKYHEIYKGLYTALKPQYQALSKIIL